MIPNNFADIVADMISISMDIHVWCIFVQLKLNLRVFLDIKIKIRICSTYIIKIKKIFRPSWFSYSGTLIRGCPLICLGYITAAISCQIREMCLSKKFNPIQYSTATRLSNRVIFLYC